MFGFADDRRLSSPASELQHYLRGIERLIDRIGNSSRGRSGAEPLAETIAEQLSGMAERLQDRASRVGKEASHLGYQVSNTGRDSLAALAKEVSANPLAAVGAAMAVGLVVGAVLSRGTAIQQRTPARRRVRNTRKRSRR